MPLFEVTDPVSGTVLEIEGDSDPTDDELEGLFVTYRQPPKQEQAASDFDTIEQATPFAAQMFPKPDPRSLEPVPVSDNVSFSQARPKSVPSIVGQMYPELADVAAPMPLAEIGGPDWEKSFDDREVISDPRQRSGLSKLYEETAKAPVGLGVFETDPETGNTVMPWAKFEPSGQEGGRGLSLATPGAKLLEQLPEGTIKSIGTGAYNAAANLINFFLTPQGASLGGISQLPQSAQRAISLGFATHMATAVPDQLQAGDEAMQRGDVRGAVENWLGAGGGAVLAGLAAKHGFKPGAKPKTSPDVELTDTARTAMPVPDRPGTIAEPLRPVEPEMTVESFTATDAQGSPISSTRSFFERADALAQQRQLEAAGGKRGAVPLKPESGAELKQPNPDWQVTVQAEQEGIPKTGFVQIDDVAGGKNNWSKSQATLNKEGYSIPDFSKLPQGKYTYEQAVNMLEDKPLNPGGALKDLPPELQKKSNAVQDAMRDEFEKLKQQAASPTTPNAPEGDAPAATELKLPEQPVVEKAVTASAATQGTPFERDTGKPTTAMQYRGDINQKLEYIPETEAGRVQEVGRIMEGFGDNAEGALKFFERPPDMSGVPVSMRVIAGERLAKQAANREFTSKNDVDRLKWGEVRKRAHQLAQSELSQAGQALQTGAQLKREYQDSGAGMVSEAEGQFEALKELDSKFPDLSPEAKQRIYEAGQRIEDLSTLNQAEKQGIKTPEEEATRLRQKLAFTGRERLRKKIEIEVEIAKEKLKNGWRGWLTPEGRRARAQVMNEVVSANLLTTPTFLTKQVVDVFSQYAWHLPTRALAQAINLPREGTIGQRTGQLASDAGHELASSIKDVINSRQAALRYALEGAKGRGSHFRDTLGFSQDMKFLERADKKIQEAIKSKQYWKAIWPGYISILKTGIREARALDELTGTMVENIDIRQQVEAQLRQAGATPEQARSQARNAVGNFMAEYSLAEQQAKLISSASGIEVPASEFKAMVWDLVHQNSLERVRAMNLPAASIEKGAVLTGRTFAWNEREIGAGPGGNLLGTPLEAVRKYLEGVGVPSPFTAFANAISIGTNRALTHAGLGMFPKLFKGSKFYETPKDRTQRKIEAGIGLAATALFVTLAQSGLIRVRNRLSTNPNDRQDQEAQGRKWGTVEINTGDGKFIPVSMNTGPLAYFRIPLSIIGAVQDSNDRSAAKTQRIEKEAAAKDMPLEQPVDGSEDLMGIMLGAASAGVFGGRTMGGLQGAFTDQAQGFNVKKPVTSAVTAMVPLMPAVKATERLSGVNLDMRRASLFSMILPSPLSGSSDKYGRLNDWGEPASPQTAARIIGTLTGGTVPWEIDGQPVDPVKELALKFGWSPSTIDLNKYYATENDTLRKLSNDESRQYLKRRGELLHKDMEQVLKKFPLSTWDEQDARDEFDAAFKSANEMALEELKIVP